MAKNPNQGGPALTRVRLHHDQGPCPIESQRVEYKLA